MPKESERKNATSVLEFWIESMEMEEADFSDLDDEEEYAHSLSHSSSNDSDPQIDDQIIIPYSTLTIAGFANILEEITTELPDWEVTKSCPF